MQEELDLLLAERERAFMTTPSKPPYQPPSQPNYLHVQQAEDADRIAREAAEAEYDRQQAAELARREREDMEARRRNQLEQTSQNSPPPWWKR